MAVFFLYKDAQIGTMDSQKTKKCPPGLCLTGQWKETLLLRQAD
jgi:hypothetical protein